MVEEVSQPLGFTNPQTHEDVGSVDGREVVVIRRNYNFISTTTMTTLKIPITTTAEFGVSLDTGVAAHSQGRGQVVVTRSNGGGRIFAIRTWTFRSYLGGPMGGEIGGSDNQLENPSYEVLSPW